MNILTGALFMVIFCLTLPAADVIVRILNEAGMNVFQITFIRSFGIVIILFPLLIYKKEVYIKKKYWLLYAMRSLFLFTAILIWLSILQYVHLSDLYAVGFTAPLFTTALGVLFLKEKMTWVKLVGLIGGLTGAMIVIRPGFRDVSPYIWFALISAIGWSVAMVITKFLSATQSQIKLTGFLSLSFIPLTMFVAIPNWITPTFDQWKLLALVTFFTIVSNLALVESFKRAPLTVLTPIEFMTLLFSAILGWVFFKENLDMTSVVGGLTIFVSASFSTLMTKNKKRRKNTLTTDVIQ
ncbi:DMT family transporter [bacterium]|jgi:drug/metabolite transporter (DMT)-like permease|nr:DMT family transporter [bacterium]